MPNNDLTLPDYLIHWNKQNGLGFTVYDLNVGSKKIKNEKTLNDLITYLTKLGIIDLFDAIADGNDIIKSKPAPRCF